MKELLEQAKAIQEDLVKHRRQFHMNPEIGLDLPLTVKYVKEKLTEMGYEPKDCGKGGVVAIAGKGEGKVFLLRGDMDALPIKEETGEPFQSENEYMHACGHDMHTAMLLGAAKLLKDNEDKLSGKVKLMFQPGEEILGGAKNMIDNGILENPKVDAGMMIHITRNKELNVGDVLYANMDIISASSDSLKIEVQGKGGHGARPFECIDPLNVIAHIYISLQELLAREIKSSDEVILTVGQIHGGNASNIIPDTAFLEGTIRCFNEETRQFIKKRAEEIALHTAEMFRAKAEVSFPLTCPSVKTDQKLRAEFAEYTKELLSEEQVIDLVKLVGAANAKTTGSEDFGYISNLIPVASANLVVGNGDDGCSYGLHHPKVIFREEPLHIGAAVYANMAIEWLKNNK